MPPSGYSPKAVEGILTFMQSCFEDLLKEVSSGKYEDYETGIRFEIAQIEKAIASADGSIKKAVEGTLLFTTSCYKDLLKEVSSGKHESHESAIRFEIAQAGKALKELHIDKDGNLVKR